MNESEKKEKTYTDFSPEELDVFIKEVSERLEKKIRELEEAKLGLEEKVKQRTNELQTKVMELEKFQKFAVGREMKMVELKKEIEKLKEELKKQELDKGEE